MGFSIIYVKPEDILFEIINNDDFYIELQVFERDINRISEGQKVIYDCNIPESNNNVHEAEIVSVGNYVDAVTKNFKVHAKPKKCTLKMRHGIYVNAEIKINEHKIYVLPDLVVLNDGKDDFVFTADDKGILQKQLLKQAYAKEIILKF